MGRSPKSPSTATMPPALSPGPQAAERHLHVAGRPLALRPKCGCKASTALDFCLIDRALGAERGQGTGAGAAAAAGGRGAEEAEEEAECLGAAQVGPLAGSRRVWQLPSARRLQEELLDRPSGAGPSSTGAVQ